MALNGVIFYIKLPQFVLIYTRHFEMSLNPLCGHLDKGRFIDYFYSLQITAPANVMKVGNRIPNSFNWV